MTILLEGMQRVRFFWWSIRWHSVKKFRSGDGYYFVYLPVSEWMSFCMREVSKEIKRSIVAWKLLRKDSIWQARVSEFNQSISRKIQPDQKRGSFWLLQHKIFLETSRQLNITQRFLSIERQANESNHECIRFHKQFCTQQY